MSIWTDLLFLHGFLVRPVEDLGLGPTTTPTPPAAERRKLKLIPTARPVQRRTVEQEARLLRELWVPFH
jgi:hypothetical protein